MAATIPIFDGMNYEFWKVKMTTLFKSRDLWDTVKNGYEDKTDKEKQSGTDKEHNVAPGKGKQIMIEIDKEHHAEPNKEKQIDKEKQKKNAEALYLIQQGVSDQIFEKIMDAQNAKDAWDFLQNTFKTGPTLPFMKALTKALLVPENISKSKDTNLIVATLIATVTFAAGITMPGGYINDNKDPNQGMAILTRKAAFKVFVITDTIALTLSVFAVLTHHYTTDHPILLKPQLATAFLCTDYAMIAMLLAFITGTYAVLASSSLSIFVWVIPSVLSVLYLLYYSFFLRLVSDDVERFSTTLSPPSEQKGKVSKIIKKFFPWKSS